MNRIVLAFRAFFNLLFSGELSSETLIALNLSRRSAAAPAKAAPAPAAPTVRTSDGALQILAIVQRDSRLIDFLTTKLAPQCANCTISAAMPSAAMSRSHR